MKEHIKKILTNHDQSTLDGLHQITGGDIRDVAKAVEDLIEEGWIKTGTAAWGGTDWIVYKRVKQKNKIKP